MDNRSQECPLCRMYTEANRMGQSWQMVNEKRLENENELAVHDEANTTRTSKKRTGSQ